MPDARAHWSWLGLLVGLVGLAWVNARIQPWTLDDAYISFRYAENLASGVGPVYNPGERVEGYTTPLWVALLALGHGLGLDTRALSKGLGLAAAIGTLGLLALSHRVVPAIPREAGAVAAALTGTCAVFAAWAMPGMEVPLVALLLTGTALASLRDGSTEDAWGPAGLCGALAMMARPDSVVLVGVFAGAAGVRAAIRRSWVPLRAPALTAAVYGPYFLARWAYYGWPLPNTFYAKVGATGAQLARGLEYLGDAAVPLAAVCVPHVLLLARFGAARHRYAGLGALWAALGAHGAYVVAVGGDVMPAFRFLASVLPLLALGAGLALALVPRGPLVGGLIGVLLGVWQLDAHPDLAPRIARGVVGLNGEEVGLWLREHAPPDAVIATNTAGSVPYFSRLRAIDMLGLNDAHIAHSEVPRMGAGRAGHEKADGAYVFARSPELVHLGSARGSAKPVFRSDRELVRQPGFAERYVLQRHRLPSGAMLVLYVRRDLVESGAFPVRGR